MDTKPTKEVVIASYLEDVSWTRNISSDIRVFDYNKAGRTDTCLQLPNIGRESHTYLYHILENYEKFSDYIFFFQGNPFDHTGQCLNLINGGPDIWNSNVQMYFDGYWGYAHNSFGTMWKLEPSLQFSGECLSCRKDGYPHCDNFAGGILPINEVWIQIFEMDIPENLEFIPGCQFHVHKSLIYNKTLAFWEKLYMMSLTNVNFPWIFERIAPYVFNNKFQTKL